MESKVFPTTRPVTPPRGLPASRATPRGFLARALLMPVRGLLWVANEVWRGYPPTSDELRRER